MCTIGRQGVPSLLSSTFPEVNAQATRLLSTRSKRRRGETPYAVALRRNVGLKSASASVATSCSTRTLEVA